MKSPVSKSNGLLWLMLILSNYLCAQVYITLIQPPPNQWHIEDLWNLSLFNAGETMDVYLHATVEEVTRGLVFDGNSTKFELAQGATGRIDPYSLEPIRINHNDPDLEELVLRLGKLPPGTFTVCMTVNDASNDEELARDCYTQVIIQITPPELINPGNSVSLPSENPVFTWLPSGINSFEADVQYTLVISEVIGEQTPYEAINTTPYFFMEEGITTTNFLYPTDAQAFEPDKQYAWQIISYVDRDLETGRSEIWTFYGRNNTCSFLLDSVKIRCRNEYGCLGATWYISNPVSNGRSATLFFDQNISHTPGTVNLWNFGYDGHTPLNDRIVNPGDQIIVTTHECFESPIQSICHKVGLKFQDPDCETTEIICLDYSECNDCCKEFEAIINTESVSCFHSPTTPYVDEIVILDNITSPNEFRQVNAEIIEYERTLNGGNDCKNCCCNKDSRSYGVFIQSSPYEVQTGVLSNSISGAGWNALGAPQQYTGAGTNLYSREVMWYSQPMVNFTTGINTILVIGVPEFNQCGCSEEYKIKIRYTFTGLDCKPCDRVVEYELSRTTDNTKSLEQ